MKIKEVLAHIELSDYYYVVDLTKLHLLKFDKWYRLRDHLFLYRTSKTRYQCLDDGYIGIIYTQNIDGLLRQYIEQSHYPRYVLLNLEERRLISHRSDQIIAI